MVPAPVAVGNRLYLSASQGTSNFSQCLEMVAKDGGIEPRLVYESDKPQCNQYHTLSILDGAVYGCGEAADALQCTAMADGKLVWQKEAAEWRKDRH